jgi:hypothetical protein
VGAARLSCPSDRRRCACGCIPGAGRRVRECSNKRIRHASGVTGSPGRDRMTAQSVQGENRRIIARRKSISLPIDLSALRICLVGDLYPHVSCIPGVQSLLTLLGGPPRTPCSSEFLNLKSSEISSLTHTRRIYCFCNQNADQLGFLAGLSLLNVYVGVVECATASPYTYSSFTHRFPDERTPIEAKPLSATSAALGSGLGLGLGLGSHFSFTRSFTRSPSSRHPPFTQYPFPSPSLVRDAQTSPHMPRLVVPHSTCPSLVL